MGWVSKEGLGLLGTVYKVATGRGDGGATYLYIGLMVAKLKKVHVSFFNFFLLFLFVSFSRPWPMLYTRTCFAISFSLRPVMRDEAGLQDGSF